MVGGVALLCLRYVNIIRRFRWLTQTRDRSACPSLWASQIVAVR